MIPNPWVIIAALAVLAGSNAWSYLHGVEVAQGRQARLQQQYVDTVRAQERARQHDQDQRTQELSDEKDRIYRDLLLDYERLRQRAARLPESARADCAGATGRELSREDAELLSRIAADADRQRAALKACYDYADAVGSTATR